MTLLKLILASDSAYFRGTKDVTISKIDHNRIKQDGVWGPATYLSEDRATAEWYARKNCKRFGVLTEYSISGSVKILVMTSGVDYKHPHPADDNVTLLPKGMKKLGTKEKQIDGKHFTDLAKKQGYDAIDLQDKSPIAAEPMLILFKPGQMKPVKYHVWRDEDNSWKSFPASQVKKAEAYIAALLKKWPMDEDDD